MKGTTATGRRSGLHAGHPTPKQPPPPVGLQTVRYTSDGNEVGLFRRLKGYRRVFTRYDKLDVMFLAFITLALIHDTLRKRETRPSRVSNSTSPTPSRTPPGPRYQDGPLRCPRATPNTSSPHTGRATHAPRVARLGACVWRLASVESEITGVYLHCCSYRGRG